MKQNDTTIDILNLMPFGVLGLVLVVRLVREYVAVGIGGINYVGNAFLAVGWILGYLLGEADHLFYALVCNPQELSCMRVKEELTNQRWHSAWVMLKSTSSERTRLPIHNILTTAVVALMGIWMVTSSGNLLASGLVVGLSVRLVWELWQASDWSKWYWIFAREFSVSEHKIIRGVLTALVVFQCLGLLR